ncbi:MAG: hypothetical protein V4623_07860 [Pseudomonadota bacterium]
MSSLSSSPISAVSVTGSASPSGGAVEATRPFDRQYLFERGLEPLTPGLFEPVTLPEAADLYPINSYQPLRADALLRPPSIDDYLCASFRPAIDDPMLLLPGHFRTVLRRALAQLRRITLKKGSASAEALSVLSEEDELETLLDYYLRALFKA